MSVLWVLALGGSIGYLMFQRQAVESRLKLAVREWEGSGAEPAARPEDGASFGEIKHAWKETSDTRTRDFDERLPASERARLLAAEDRHINAVKAYDQKDAGRPIEGVYLESAVA